MNILTSNEAFNKFGKSLIKTSFRRRLDEQLFHILEIKKKDKKIYKVVFIIPLIFVLLVF